MNFELLLDDLFINIATDDSLSPIERKLVLSVVNGYEDGSWRHSDFQNFIWDNIAETSLSAQERKALAGKSRSILIAAAKNLRLVEKDADIGRGSELAEIALYGIMKHHYGALPVVPKIFYKQNPQDNAKGADSVHVVLEEDDFSLWFGEAKFYRDIDNVRLTKIIKSVEEALGTEKLKKENSIITNVGDLSALVAEESLRNRIVAALSNRASIDDLKERIHIPILILHECEITQAYTRLCSEYRRDIVEFHKERANAYFAKQVGALKDKIFMYEHIHFHLILFPVPSKEAVIDAFVDEAAFYKGKK